MVPSSVKQCSGMDDKRGQIIPGIKSDPHSSCKVCCCSDCAPETPHDVLGCGMRPDGII